jgi:hypothetical protein
MTRALPHRVALLVWSLAASTCFDVTKVPLPPLSIDDFDDGDLEPRTDRFGRWSCRTFSNTADDAGTPPDPDGGAPNVQCRVGPVGNNHPFAMSLRFTLDDPADGERQLGGAELATQSSQTSVDFGAFRQLVLSATLESGSPALPTGTQLRVEIGCALAGMPRTLEHTVPIVIGADWENFPLDLANFAPAQPGCLRQVDALRVSVRPGLPDGQSTRGALHVDNIYLQ